MPKETKLHKLLRELEEPSPSKTHVDYHEELGSERHNTGFVKMPLGYTLMLSASKTFYYWLRGDGEVGGSNHDKWEVVRSAKEDSRDPEIKGTHWFNTK